MVCLPDCMGICNHTCNSCQTWRSEGSFWCHQHGLSVCMCVCDHADPGQPGVSLGVSLDGPKLVVFSFLSDHADFLQQVSDVAVRRLPQDASLVAVERSVADAIRRACKEFNQRHPDVIVIAHEMDPRCACSASKEKERKEKQDKTRQDKTRLRLSASIQ